MHEEAGEHGDGVPAQLPAQRARILHVQDLPRHQEDDPEREIPEEQDQQVRVQLSSPVGAQRKQETPEKLLQSLSESQPQPEILGKLGRLQLQLTIQF